jgi:diaminohydroxyphosphoribosylaminopyrimidine deaminase / 5-amino-6-(5-phosphoribosylamino)uracil reductase
MLGGGSCRRERSGLPVAGSGASAGPKLDAVSRAADAVSGAAGPPILSTDMSLETETDRRHLERAIELAERGRGHVSPNPMVGAVVGRDGQAIGEGFHRALGAPHAEVEAIRAAGGSGLQGTTLYVSLEPCCHHGRTPPCTEAILRAGIGRVVVASDDPSAHASGRGLGILRDEGVEVVVADGDLAARARLQNQPFRKHARTGRPWVLFKSAMTLDGKVATHTGDSQWISGEASRMRSHRWRGECDAIAVGIGTALADDPQLTPRTADVARHPRRVVFDSLGRLPLHSQLLKGARRTPLTVVVSRAAPRTATDALKTHGAEVIVATGGNEPARVMSALDQLGAAGISSILLEGGPHLAGAFLDAGEIDEIRLFLAPLLLGGRTARDPIEGEGVDVIADAVRALSLECERIDEDLLISARVREW